MRIFGFIFAIGALAALLLLAAGPGVRFDLWHYRTGFTLMRWAAYLGLAAAGLAVIALAVKRPGSGPQLVLGIAALALGAASVAAPWHWLQRARSVPPIHDITTDTQDPPEFDAVLPLRAAAPNPAEYGGPDVAEQQRQAYPDLETLTLEIAPDSAFARALAAARALGWEIVAADSTAGRIEATATTAWFGFKDDVVVRIRGGDGGSEIDVRSVSRVGRSDVGTNARRIRAYLDLLREG